MLFESLAAIFVLAFPAEIPNAVKPSAPIPNA